MHAGGLMSSSPPGMVPNGGPDVVSHSSLSTNKRVIGAGGPLLKMDSQRRIKVPWHLHHPASFTATCSLHSIATEMAEGLSRNPEVDGNDTSRSPMPGRVLLSSSAPSHPFDQLVEVQVAIRTFQCPFRPSVARTYTPYCELCVHSRYWPTNWFSNRSSSSSSVRLLAHLSSMDTGAVWGFSSGEGRAAPSGQFP